MQRASVAMTDIGDRPEYSGHITVPFPYIRDPNLVLTVLAKG